MRDATLQMISEEKLIAIVRGVGQNTHLSVADALFAGGIRMMEVTFDQRSPARFQETADAIAAICAAYEPRMLVGAGTVVSVAQVELAARAGAKYIISPDVNVDVIRRTRELGLVSLPGAQSPSEVLTAHAAGADYVKLFPAGSLGADYVKAIRGPLSHIKMLAVGGIDEKNLAEFLRAGMSGAGIGGNLVNKAWIEQGRFDKITALAAELVRIAKGSV